METSRTQPITEPEIPARLVEDIRAMLVSALEWIGRLEERLAEIERQLRARSSAERRARTPRDTWLRDS